MEQRLAELLKSLNRNITFFESKNIFGVVELLEECKNNLILSIKELDEYCKDNESEE